MYLIIIPLSHFEISLQYFTELQAQTANFLYFNDKTVTEGHDREDISKKQ